MNEAQHVGYQIARAFERRITILALYATLYGPWRWMRARKSARHKLMAYRPQLTRSRTQRIWQPQ